MVIICTIYIRWNCEKFSFDERTSTVVRTVYTYTERERDSICNAQQSTSHHNTAHAAPIPAKQIENYANP